MAARTETADRPARPGGRIRLLDALTVNQIAAGEVVERPSAALKELIENALDAGATRIQVEIEGAGRELLSVEDDGCGMTPEEVRAALQRHATSKIARASDLSGVETYGFRGEALPAIAAVARVEISTGTGDGARRLLKIEGGEILADQAASGPAGTRIVARDLFHNTPARLKFLKSDGSETSACIEACSRAALARPDVAFMVRSRGKTAIQTSGSGDLMDALGAVWGRECARALAAVDRFGGGARVRGFVSPPHYTRPTRSQQWIFVNGRPIRSRSLTAAIDAASRELTPERRFLVACLMIECDPATLDVNVSPTKSEVKFRDDRAVFDAVRRAIRDALMETGMVPRLGGLMAAQAALAEARPSAGPFLAGPTPGAAPDLAPGHALQEAGSSLAPPSEAPSARLPDLMQGLKILGQFDQTFILAENDHSLLVIDQHVAHERILYEMLKATRGASGPPRQKLLEPVALNLAPHVFDAVKDRLGDLAEAGFELEAFGSESVLVRAVPSVSKRVDPVALLRDILSEMAEGTDSGPGDARDEIFILCSCKMAIKAGDRMGAAEMERLVEDLAKTENPYLCPHGRPITIMLPKGDLRRRFHR